MITPSFALTATERVLPKLTLNFMSASINPLVTVVRANNTATRINSSGAIEIVNADLPRFDYDPTTLLCKGLLIESGRSNYFLNSLINGTNLSTQSVTTSPSAYTLSFYGTGSIVLSGTHSATVAGTGVFPSRKTYTFTPTAGTLTATVSGTVQYAQLELGLTASSFIPTAGSSVARSADQVSVSGTNFSSWYNQSEGTFKASFICADITSNNPHFITVDDGINGATNRYAVFGLGTGFSTRVIVSTTQYNPTMSGTRKQTSTDTVTFAYKANSCAAAANGGSTGTSAPPSLPVGFAKLLIGNPYTLNSTGYMNGWMQQISYWPQRLTNAEVQAFSK